MSAVTIAPSDLDHMSLTDCAYVDQGYDLPVGWRWRDVALCRRRLGYAPEHVPCFERKDGQWAFRWGVPCGETGMPLMQELV